MSSTDDEIQKIIARKKREAEATAEKQKRDADVQTARQKLERDTRDKWARDTHIIAEIVPEIQTKAAELNVKLTFSHGPGNPGVTVGTATFSGIATGTPQGTMEWNVHSDGIVRIFYGRKLKARPIETTEFKLADAVKATYESQIIRFIDLLV